MRAEVLFTVPRITQEVLWELFRDPRDSEFIRVINCNVAVINFDAMDRRTGWQSSRFHATRRGFLNDYGKVEFEPHGGMNDVTWSRFEVFLKQQEEFPLDEPDRECLEEIRSDERARFGRISGCLRRCIEAPENSVV